MDRVDDLEFSCVRACSDRCREAVADVVRERHRLAVEDRYSLSRAWPKHRIIDGPDGAYPDFTVQSGGRDGNCRSRDFAEALAKKLPRFGRRRVDLERRVDEDNHSDTR